MDIISNGLSYCLCIDRRNDKKKFRFLFSPTNKEKKNEDLSLVAYHHHRNMFPTTKLMFFKKRHIGSQSIDRLIEWMNEWNANFFYILFLLWNEGKGKNFSCWPLTGQHQFLVYESIWWLNNNNNDNKNKTGIWFNSNQSMMTTTHTLSIFPLYRSSLIDFFKKKIHLKFEFFIIISLLYNQYTLLINTPTKREKISDREVAIVRKCIFSFIHSIDLLMMMWMIFFFCFL